MRLDEINLRDPYILLSDDIYYLYGTRGKNCWGIDDGLDCYYSKDMEKWNGPVEVFHKPEGFWADRNYWAPECHYYNGSYYLFVSFYHPDYHRGTQILKADHPLGPFSVHSSKPVTPADWDCLDGTFYVDQDGQPYMVFCHEWFQINDGEICLIPLRQDFKEASGPAVTLFKGSDAPWAQALNPDELPPVKKQKDCYVTDGPFIFEDIDGTLCMLWSGFGNGGYVEAVAKSQTGKITGPWKQLEQPVYTENGGHGMLFKGKDQLTYLVLHAPNTRYQEHPVCIPVR